MSNTRSTHKMRRGAAAVLAALMLAACAAGCGSSGSSGSSGGSEKAVDAIASFSEKKVKEFTETSTRANARFTSGIFKLAGAAALAYTGKEETLSDIVTTLSLDSIAVTDDKGKVVAAFPEELKGTSLKDNEHTKSLNPVAKGISVKAIGDIVPNEDGSYTVYAGVERKDAAGAVVISLQSEEYADVIGTNLAGKCGENVIIEKDGKRLSSDFTAAGDQSIEQLGVTEDGKMTAVTADGKTYQAKAATIDNYRVLTALDEAASSDGETTTK